MFGQSSTLYQKIPFNNAVFSTNQDSVFFSWNDIGAANYDLVLSQDISFSNPTIFSTSSSSKWVQQNQLFNNTYWKVEANSGEISSTQLLSIVDLSNLGSLVYRVDGETGITETNNKVSNWDNDAGASYNSSQPVNGVRPDLAVDEINGSDVVRFGGEIGASTQHLELPAEFIIPDTNFTVFTSYQQKSNNSVLPYLLGSSASNLGGLHVSGTFGNYNNIGLFFTPNSEMRVAGTGAFNWGVHSLKHNKIYSNSNEVSNYITGAPIDFFKFNSIGTRMDVPTLNFHGDLAEVIIYNTSLPDAERDTVENYLMTKYSAYPDLGKDIDTCTAEVSLSFKNDPGFSSIQWSNGSTNTDSISVQADGWYWVEVVAFDRTIRDSIHVSGLVPQPELSQLNDTTLCLFDTLDVNLLNNMPSGVSLTWSDGTTANEISVATSDTIYVQASSGSCTISSDTIVVDINNFPATEGLGQDRSICLNTNVFFDYGSASSGPYTNLWGDGSITPSIEPTAIGTQEYTIEVTDTMGCIARDTVNLTLINQAGPSPFFEIDTVCPFSPHSLQDASTPAVNDPIIFYTWDLPTTSLNGNNQPYQSTTTEPYVVLLTISTQNGCSSSYADTAYFFEQPEVTISATGNCENQSIDFMAGQSSTNLINSWEWDFGDPSSGANNTASGVNPSHIYQSFGDYNVELIGVDENNCNDTITEVISIDPEPEVDFDFLEVCFGNPVFFNNQTTIDASSGSNIVNYVWDFGDATNSGQTNPSKIYNLAGTYAVTLSAESSEGCIDTLIQDVKIHEYPLVGQSVQSSCAGIEFTLEDESFVNNGSIGNVDWLVNQSTVLSGFTVNDVVDQEGAVEVVQTVQSAFGCQSVDTFSFELLSYLNADFTIEPNSLIAGTPISFSSTSAGAEAFEWTFESLGNFSFEDSSIVIPFDLIGDTIDIQLAVENNFNCRDSLLLSLPVLEQKIDLSLDELFIQESNDSYITGVRLSNSGNTPITEVDLMLYDASLSVITETWEGTLLAGESEIYIFSNSPASTISEDEGESNYICVTGTVIQPDDNEESDLTNNEACKLISPSEQVLLSPSPNPIEDKYTVKIILSFNDIGTLKVIDAQGKEVDVIFENEPISAGLSSFEVDASTYANGGYFLRYVGERKIEQVKMIKQ